MDVIEYEFQNHKFKFHKTLTAPALIREIFSDNYRILQSGIQFKSGDIVIDVGANEGVFSIMLAKLFPEIQIIAIEPVPNTFNTLCKNLQLNNIDPHTRIIPKQIALGAEEAGSVTLNVSKDYSGGSSSFCTFTPSDQYQITVPSTSLDYIFELFQVEHCKLLKIDTEGAEYDILYNFHQFSKVEYMTMEIHHNQKLEYQGRRMDGLVNWLNNQTQLIHVDICNMAE